MWFSELKVSPAVEPLGYERSELTSQENLRKGWELTTMFYSQLWQRAIQIIKTYKHAADWAVKNHEYIDLYRTQIEHM